MLRGKRWTKRRYADIRPVLIGSPTLAQISDAMKRYSYLLGQTELFKHFVDIKVSLRIPLASERISWIAIESERSRIRSSTGRSA